MISSIALPVIGNDETTLPDDLLQIIRQGGDPNADRSALFHSVVAQLKRRRWNITEIVTLLEKYPNGIAQKYLNRIGKEVERSYAKINTTGSAGTALQAMSTPPAAGAAPGSSSDRQQAHREQQPPRERARVRLCCRRFAWSLANCPARSKRPNARYSPPVHLSSSAPAFWSSRSARPWLRPTGERPRSHGCARCAPICCWSRSPRLRYSSASIPSATLGSTSTRRSDSCA